jgi:hypothetical protein
MIRSATAIRMGLMGFDFMEESGAKPVFARLSFVRWMPIEKWYPILVSGMPQ